VKKTVSRIPDLGELYYYDTALHIGAKLGLMPVKVYLHAGTKDGARRLKLSCRNKTIDFDQLPIELRCLAPYEIEDFLCIFKKGFPQVNFCK
jgi:hypothetical protein